MSTQLDQDVLKVLDEMRIDGSIAFLPSRQLDRKLYLLVNAVLEAIGGKWSRKERGHVFDDDPSEAIDTVILTGAIEKPTDLGFFPTPLALARQAVALADIKPWSEEVLEPSAGMGALVDAILERNPLQLTMIEVYEKRYIALKEHLKGRCDGCMFIRGDFLKIECKDLGIFDSIVMNPPFGKQQDIQHVAHAMQFLKPGGRLVSFMAAGVLFRDNTRTKDFRAQVKRLSGVFTPLSENSFRSSGTNVNAVLLSVRNS